MRRVYVIIFIVLLLVVIDQGAKIYINSTLEAGDESLAQVENTLHIHHLINYEAPNQWTERAEVTGLSISFWKWFHVTVESAFPAFLLLAYIYFIHRFTSFAGLKTHTPLAGAVFTLIGAASVCGLIDKIFWECTHDFICVSKTFISGTGKPLIGHSCADIKDYYMYVVMFLFIIWGGLFVLDFLRLPKKKECISAFFKSLRRVKSRSI